MFKFKIHPLIWFQTAAGSKNLQLKVNKLFGSDRLLSFLKTEREMQVALPVTVSLSLSLSLSLSVSVSVCHDNKRGSEMTQMSPLLGGLSAHLAAQRNFPRARNCFSTLWDATKNSIYAPIDSFIFLKKILLLLTAFLPCENTIISSMCGRLMWLWSKIKYVSHVTIDSYSKTLATSWLFDVILLVDYISQDFRSMLWKTNKSFSNYSSKNVARSRRTWRANRPTCVVLYRAVSADFNAFQGKK